MAGQSAPPYYPKENVTRWNVVGMALHTVLTPVLIPYVEEAINQLYKKLCTTHQIDKQGNQKTFPKHGTHTLNYGNINGNTKQIPKVQWDFSVQTPMDFARLFMKPYMCKHPDFSKCDTSALLGLVINVDDTLGNCSFQNVRQEAEELMDIRNAWGHADYDQFTHAIFEVNVNQSQQPTTSQQTTTNTPFDNITSILNTINAEQKFHDRLQDLKNQETTYATVKIEDIKAVQELLSVEIKNNKDIKKNMDQQGEDIQKIEERIGRFERELTRIGALEKDVAGLKKRQEDQEMHITSLNEDTKELKVKQDEDTKRITLLEDDTGELKVKQDEDTKKMEEQIGEFETKFTDTAVRIGAQEKDVAELKKKKVPTATLR